MSVKLSLICPVYKVGQYLPELMQSLVAGINTEQVEVIFVDDCCPENSIEVCETFIEQHRSDILFNPKVVKLDTNLGQAGARNVALKLAKGTYIGFIDSDDAISPLYWSTVSSYVDKSVNDIIEFGFEEFTDSLPVVSSSEVANIEELESSNLNPFYSGFFVWTRLYKKTIVNELFFPEGKIYEDIFYNIHAFSKSNCSVRLNQNLVFYRKRDNSTTTSRDASYSNLLLNMVESVKSTIDCFKQKNIVMFQLARYSLLVSLKGFTIKNKLERRDFFNQCKEINKGLSPLFNKYNSSLLATIKFNVSRLVCSVGRFL